MLKKAKIADIKQIHSLINYFSKKDLMLARSLNEIYENLRDFWIFEQGKKIIACCALHISWQDLAEIKSLAVTEESQKKGIGRKLVCACVGEARQLGAKKIFALTYVPEFFRKCGFKKVSHSSLPHKIWAECINCPKFPGCQETAMIRKI